MPKISITCLIYKSVRWLKFVYDQVLKHTDMTDKEFYFVANDACPAVLAYLKDNNIPHYVHNNTEEQRTEFYINNVYRAWNTAGRMAKGDYVVFINSDMAFSPGWLDNLVNKLDDTKIVNSRLVERGIMRSGTYGIERNFGNVPGDYDEAGFLKYAKLMSNDNLLQGGLFMPCIIKKEHLEKVGYYPEGNVLAGSDIFNPKYALKGDYTCTPGDKAFIQKLRTIGVTHWTAFDSVVYHFQEGEMRDASD